MIREVERERRVGKRERRSTRKKRWDGGVFGRPRIQHMAARFEGAEVLGWDGDGEKKGPRFGILGPGNTL